MKKILVNILPDFISTSSTLVTLDYDGTNGFYACAIPDAKSKELIMDVAFELGSKQEDLESKLHTTVISSRAALTSLPRNLPRRFEGICKSVIVIDGNAGKKILACSIDCPVIENMHKVFIGYGASHQYEDFECHITLLVVDADTWKVEEEKIRENIDRVNRQLEERRIVVSYTDLKLCNQKD